MKARDMARLMRKCHVSVLMRADVCAFFWGGRGVRRWSGRMLLWALMSSRYKRLNHTHIHLYIHTYVCTCVRCDVVVNVQLPERAPKHTMIKRHQEFILLLQAQADSIDPMTGL